ncbi:MAG: hypothetical protein KME07_05500 [Pegethrix bostrychoides GSE-TBD4-15B]|jgi:hypothetical protein|uniref:Uncharacterized protein n=1 Tax=Pegethrix bostrychoides GSE-TBD4-15B TaxID=2839662 RepID=A0A951U3P3_9CYAN|nr:hypothetical protein [Pegethrix bostrychoides GSE-TBD4-15B]
MISTEFNELLNDFGGDRDGGDSGGDFGGEKMQIWLIGSREQVQHTVNEFYVKRIATDRIQFSPVIPVPFSPGKYMSVLTR